MTNNVKRFAKELKGRRFDDAISVCAAVSREYGIELTIAEGRSVYNALTPTPIRLDYHVEQATARE
jgi:hypothetical protein